MRRLLEVDALRGLAIVMMIIYHLAFDLNYLEVIHADVDNGFWFVWVRIVQFLFLGICGVSVYLSKRGFKGQLERGFKIFMAGMLVSFVTWVFVGDGYVKFGILHLIGVAVPVVVLFKRRPKAAIVASVVSILLGRYFLTLTPENPYLFPFGLVAGGFYSLDFFPIFPWLAVPLAGLATGQLLYKKKNPTFLEIFAKVPGLTFVGRHSLLIYLVHQPVLYSILLLCVKWLS
ncbi:DUF1624 domain-containing protein [Patescibacteria group bacterium]|nr:DUF1624 domain-containing protein [Patescibacteria group bacterium]